MNNYAVMKKSLATQLMMYGADLIDVRENKYKNNFKVYYFVRNEKLKLAFDVINNMTTK